MKEMSVKVFTSVDGDVCKNIYIESEIGKFLVRRFIIFKIMP